MTREEELASDYVTEEDKELIRQMMKLEGDVAAGANIEAVLSNQVMKNFMGWIEKEVENSKNLVFAAKNEDDTQFLRNRGRTLLEVKNWFEAQIQYGKAASEAIDRDQKEMERINREFGIHTDEQ